MTNENQIKSKLIAMSKLISINIDKLNSEKLEVHESLVRLKELERQKWIAKAETMLEVFKVLEGNI
tara:strand:- start:1060 stop:1257 length:198 start_codon:yes stop_codon:yes gene_type:complete